MLPEDEQREREKWDRYYTELATDASDPEVDAFYRELARVMLSFLPPNSRILEAGCGSAQLSLALAREGNCEVSLLDFSPAAIDVARRLFAAAGVSPHVQIGDVLEAPGPADQDLVFNSGVLEHYAFERQVAFFRAMGRRSRRYVFVMVPNRECYWYWIWRIRAAAQGQWPYGFEKPATDYRAVIDAAGLHYLGRAYFGAKVVNRFLAGLAGLDPALARLLQHVHDREVVSAAQRSYLVGFLASVRREERPPAGFSPAGEDRDCADADRIDRMVAMVGDALAAQIAAENRLAAAEARLVQTQERQRALESEIQALRLALGQRG